MHEPATGAAGSSTADCVPLPATQRRKRVSSGWVCCLRQLAAGDRRHRLPGRTGPGERGRRDPAVAQDPFDPCGADEQGSVRSFTKPGPGADMPSSSHIRRLSAIVVVRVRERRCRRCFAGRAGRKSWISRTVDALADRHDLLIVDNLPMLSGPPKPDASPRCKLAMAAEAEA